MARLYTAKYYLDGDFLSVAVDSNPSFTWRSTVAGKEVLRLGLVWKVESGCSINIWKARWIPSNPGFIVGEPRIHEPNLIKSLTVNAHNIKQLG